MALLRLVAPGLIGLALVAGFRMGVDWVTDQVEGPRPAAAIPYAPATTPVEDPASASHPRVVAAIDRQR